MNNTSSLQGRQQQRQWSELMSRKQQEDQDSHSPMPLTKPVPLLTSQLEMSWLKLVASVNMIPCESRRSGTSSDIGQRKEWCEIFGLMMTMSMIIIKNTRTIQHHFKDGKNSSDIAPSSRGENNKKTNIVLTAPRHLQNWFRCQHSN